MTRQFIGILKFRYSYKTLKQKCLFSGVVSVSLLYVHYQIGYLNN